jgi:ribosome biogenesis protein BMS1
MTPVESIRLDPLCDRRIALFGYLRGCNLKPGARVHLAGVGDFSLSDVSVLPDPCPLPGSTKRRSLDERERLLYAPMSDVGRLLYDKDAMYVNIADHTVNFSVPEQHEPSDGLTRSMPVDTPGVQMVRGLQGAALALNEKLLRSNIRIFGGGESDDEAEVEEEQELPEDDDEEGYIAPSAARLRRAVPSSCQLETSAPSGGDDMTTGEEDSSTSDEADTDSDDGLGGAELWKQRIGMRAAPTLDLMVR